MTTIIFSQHCDTGSGQDAYSWTETYRWHWVAWLRYHIFFPHKVYNAPGWSIVIGSMKR